MKWADSLDQLNPNENLKATFTKLNDLIAAKGEEEVLNILAAANNVPDAKRSAHLLQIAMLTKWIKENREEDIFKKLLQPGMYDLDTFLSSPLLNVWINLYSIMKEKSPYPQLYKVLVSKHYSEAALAKQLHAVQGSDAARETAKNVASYQLTRWQRHGLNGDDVFKLLGLNVAGITNIFDRSQWDVWISFMMMEDRPEDLKPELLVSMLRKYYDDDILKKWLDGATSAIGKERAEFLKTALQELGKKEGKESSPAKRQRIE